VTCRSSSSGFWRRRSDLGRRRFGEHPGTENGPQAGLAEADLSVRVLANTLLHLPSQHLGLLSQRRQDNDQRCCAGRIGRHHPGSGSQLLRGQRGPDCGCGGRHVALSTGTP
jgi:hypothetical protein